MTDRRRHPVGDQRIDQRADLEQLVPVTAGPSQPGHLDPNDHADMPETNLGNQPLKSRSVASRCGGASKVFIDHQDTIR